jgi:hypothetical protein
MGVTSTSPEENLPLWMSRRPTPATGRMFSKPEQNFEIQVEPKF